MEYRDLTVKNADGSPRGVIKVSRLCFGSLCLGHMQSDLELREGAAVIRRAYELGVNFIDTAQSYGTYKYIKAAGPGNFIISSKTYAHTRSLAEEALEEALHELGRDYIDIFMLHEQESIHTLEGHFEALEYLFGQKERGRIKAVGLSTHHVSGVLGAVEFNAEYKKYKHKLDVIHPIYNMPGLGISGGTLTEMEAALLEAKKSGFFIFCMKALGGGLLYNRAEEALGFVFAKPFIDCAAVGMKSRWEVEANVQFTNTGKFPSGYYSDYNKVKKSLHIDGWCAGCGECVKKCRQGALKLAGGKSVCDAGKCLLCGYCAAVCRDFALKII